MAALVLQCHPQEQCFNTAVLDAVRRGLDASRPAPEVAVVRLGQGEQPPDASGLRQFDTIVAVHPTWWGGLPAPLLAWVQDTLGPWVDGGASRRSSPLRAVRRLVVVTTHGSPWRVNLLQGEPGRHLWRRTIAPLCAPGTKAHWLALYGVDTGTSAQREAFLGQVERRVAELTSEQAPS